MNIAFVNSTRKWGGVKTWTLEAARFLKDRGHGVLVLARPGPFAQSMERSGVECVSLRFGVDFSPVRIVQFRQIFKKHAIDLVVCNVGKDMRIAGLAALAAGIPVVHRVGLAGDLKDRPKIRWLHQLVKPTLLVPCRAIKDELLQSLPWLRPDEVRVILTGKVPADAPPASRHSPRRVMVTSQLNPDKGHADLLRALAACKERGLAFHLRIAGTGSEEAALKELSWDLGLREQVDFLGFCTDVAKQLKEAEIFALPSFSEGLPNTLLEAMAQGLAVAARNVGGVGEVWPAGLERFLVPPEPGPRHLEAALSELLAADDAQLAAFQRAAWETLKQRADAAAQLKELEAFFLDCVARGMRRRRFGGEKL